VLPLAFAGAFFAVQLAHNAHLFAVPVYEDSDYAANSMLVLKAKRLALLHGHYSRMGFYHPGPSLLYVLAAGEWLLYDRLAVVPAPHNAHMVAHLVLNAALLAVALAIVTRAVGARTGLAAAVAFLVYFAREGQLASHWFAHTFFLVYLPFQVAAASVAAGRTRHLGWLAFTASLAVHSHASLALFAVPISLYALARLCARGGFRARAAEPGARRAWAVFALVVGLFVLPIALHTTLNFPGEVRRYLEHRQKHAHRSGAAAEVARYMGQTLTNESEFGWLLVAGVAVAAALSIATFPARGRRFVQQLAVVGALTSGVMTYYAARGVDDYKHTYLGLFYSSVLLLGWSIIAMRIALLCRSATARKAAFVGGAAVAAWAAVAGNFANTYAGLPEMPALADKVAKDERWAGAPPLFTFDGDGWVEGGALLVQLERRGKRPWLLDPQKQLMYTDAFQPDGREVRGLWHLDAADAASEAIPTRRVLATFPTATIREVETRCPLGPIPLSGFGRRPGAKPLAGWSFSEPDRLYPVGARATLLIDLEPCPAAKARLTLKGGAILAPASAGQRVRLTVNGHAVGEVRFAVGADSEQSVEFASEVLNLRSPVAVEFEFSDAGGEAGPRARQRLSVVLTGLAITPLP
jgi:hypothetical protein